MNWHMNEQFGFYDLPDAMPADPALRLVLTTRHNNLALNHSAPKWPVPEPSWLSSYDVGDEKVVIQKGSFREPRQPGCP